MIRSMTALTPGEIGREWGSAILGNALGKPALSGNLFSPAEQFRDLEPVVRERIRTRLTRGKSGMHAAF